MERDCGTARGYKDELQSRPPERGKLLEELKTIFGAYLDAELAASLA
jgi:hypothetical protein